MASVSSTKRSARSRSPTASTGKDVDTRRADIVRETIRIVGERGYAGFSLQDLASRCQMTAAGLLYHFGSRERLLIEVLREFERAESVRMAPFAELAAAEIGKKAASAESVRGLLREMVVRVSSEIELCRLYVVLQSEAIDALHPAHAFLVNRDVATIALVRALVAPFVKQPEATARQLVALMDGLLQQWLRSARAFDVLGAWDDALEMLIPDPNGRS